MKCPSCQSTNLEVRDTRATENSVRRRRECMSCGHRWTTLELDQQTYESAKRLIEGARKGERAANRKRRGGFDIPEHLKEQYRHLTRNQGLRAREAGVALGIIHEDQ